MKVKDLMTTTVTCVRPESSLSQVASHMKQENIGSVPVCTDLGQPVGIITDRDLVLRGQPSSQAGDVMTRHLVCAHPNMDIHDASLLFAKYQVRRLPVTENGKLVGFLALSDIARKPLYVDEAGDALNAISRSSTLN